MTKFIYKWILKPKSERTPTTDGEKTFLIGFAGIGIAIMILTVGHAMTQSLLTDEQMNINDSCRVIGITSDGQNIMCKSFLHDGQYYEIDKNQLHTNIYVNRKLYHNDNNTYNEKTYDYDFKYVALTKQKRDEINQSIGN